MPIKIGERSESFLTNPLGLLSECHRRIESFLIALILATNQAKGAELNAEQRIALEASLRYFREAAPKHTLDEEESLFPRLSRVESPQGKAVITRLGALEEDHGIAEAAHKEVETLVRRWLAIGRLPGGDAGYLADLLEKLLVLYRKHIELEETEVFPLAQKILKPSEIEAIGREMAERRNVDPDALRRFNRDR